MMYFVLYRLLGYRKSVVRNNLLLSFPEKSLDEILKIEDEFYRYLSDLIVETIKIISISKKEAMRRYVIVNQHLLDEYYKNGKSVIAVAGHYGNWEMANIMCEESIYPCLVVYKPLTNSFFDSFMIKIRSRFGATMVPMKNILRKLISERDKLSMTVILSDQTPAAVEIESYTQFLNQKTAVFMGVEKIASLTRSVVVFIKMDRIRRGYYTHTFIPLTEQPDLLNKYDLTKMHLKLLEQVIRAKPQYWLWSHRRWKHDPSKIPGSKIF